MREPYFVKTRYSDPPPGATGQIAKVVATGVVAIAVATTSVVMALPFLSWTASP